MLSKEFKDGGKSVNESDFIQPFIRFERELREIYIKLSEFDMVLEIKQQKSGFISLVEIIRNLYGYELISRDEKNNITEIISYRNLVVHGNVETVSLDMVNKLKVLDEILERIKHDIQEKHK